ncbi:MAG: metallophosphoesterase [Polyangiaceae bacterium]
MTLSGLFPWVSLALAAVVTLLAGLVRGRPYVFFVGVLLGIHTLVSSAMEPVFARALGEGWRWVAPVYAYLQVTVYVNFALLARPRLRSVAYRVLVSYPSSVFVAATFLAFPWAIVDACGLPPYGFFVPYVVALLGFAQSVAVRREHVDLSLDRDHVPTLRRFDGRGARASRPLRVVQITDPHLGPFMSEARLRGIVERAVAHEPDLVLLTGDFLTMESHEARDALARALGPLRALEGRVFACRGNHDHEAPETVAGALADVGARLLVDEAEVVETAAGPVQIVGIDFHFRDRAARTRAACAENPRREGALRLVLLHDPGAFKYVPDGDADLVFSGHTHGGQLGLVSLGLAHTFVSAFTKIPDHGLWALGKNRLYVHRGTGHYGFPLRVGVPGEESVLSIHAAER